MYSILYIYKKVYIYYLLYMEMQRKVILHE
jgi:hypothetical protein